MAKRKKKDQPLLPPLAEGEWVAMPEKLEAVLVAELVPYADNARTHSPKQIRALQASIREFGFVSPVIIDAGRNILAGHGRVLADNRLAELAGWDMELVTGELEALEELGTDVSLTGFALEELTSKPEKKPIPESSTKSEKLVTCPSCGCEFSPTRRRK